MEKTELNINLMLFSWGLISGETTKFGWFKPFVEFVLLNQMEHLNVSSY